MSSRSLLAGLMAALLGLAAAPMRMSVRPVPKPDQVIHVTITQAFAIGVDAGAAAGASITTTGLLAYTQSNGRFDAQGRMASQVEIDRFEAEQNVNGTARTRTGDGVVGRSLTIVFDRGGKLVDVAVPKDLEQVSGTLRQMLAAAYSPANFLPTTAMAVGQTSAVVSDIPMRIPARAGSAPYQTRTTLTLVAVETHDGNRVAHLKQRSEPADESQQPRVDGTGTIDVNVDRGYVAASTVEWSFAGTVPTSASSATPSTGSTPAHGTIKISVTTTE